MLCDPSGPRARCLMSPTTRLEKNKRPENHLKMRELVTVLLLAGQCGAFSPSFMTTTGRIGQISSSSMGLRAGSSLVPVRSGASRLSMNSSPQAEVRGENRRRPRFRAPLCWRDENNVLHTTSQMHKTHAHRLARGISYKDPYFVLWGKACVFFSSASVSCQASLVRASITHEQNRDH